MVGAVFSMKKVNGVLGKLPRRLLPLPPLLLPAHGDAQAAAHIQLLAKKPLTSISIVHYPAPVFSPRAYNASVISPVTQAHPQVFDLSSCMLHSRSSFTEKWPLPQNHMQSQLTKYSREFFTLRLNTLSTH
ncbi:uncharacterized protein LOC135114442 isoform X3 [Scylla paramamosain]|uniref:uncharacterized protein LOC135114442 isoform X3 n=1 Tax=Scylla paramamosain TaxID=85552 RepID=UPI003082736D